MAMLRTFIESGCRLGEVARLKVEDVDFEEDVVYVVGKGAPAPPRRLRGQDWAGPRQVHTAPFAPSPGELAGAVAWAQGGHDRERHSPDARAPM